MMRPFRAYIMARMHARDRRNIHASNAGIQENTFHGIAVDTIDAIESFPYLGFFNGIRSIIEEQSISRGQINGDFADAGFAVVAHRTVAHFLAPDWASYVDKLAKRADSFLARLRDDDFQAGITALRAHAAQAGAGESVTMDVDCFVFQR